MEMLTALESTYGNDPQITHGWYLSQTKTNLVLLAKIREWCDGLPRGLNPTLRRDTHINTFQVLYGKERKLLILLCWKSC